MMLSVKLFEIRDAATFIPAIGIRIEPYGFEVTTFERYLMRRAGYGDGFLVLFTRLDGGGESHYDPYGWKNRTFQVAHDFVAKNWDSLDSGAVVDVEFILGLRPEPKSSESFETGLLGR
jgi:hypothetical protein